MAAHDYHFVTHWKVKGPLQTVYQILRDGKNYAQWWRPAYLRSEEVEPNKISSLVRSHLPYTLCFTTEPLREKAPFEFEIRASGELSGTGLWKLKQVGDVVEITFYWNVRAEKPLLRWLSFILKPLFQWNHDWVMETGVVGLQNEVSRRTKGT